MEFKKSIIILILAVFIISMSCVWASDAAIASEDNTSIGQTIETTDGEMLSATDDETVSAENDLDVLGDSESSYSDLSNQIGQLSSTNKNITLKHAYYKYNQGETISIGIADSVIDGNGSTIDMNGSTIRAFTVTASGVTIKNLTIKNANINGDGGAIWMYSGSVENCNFTNNTATNGDGGAIRMNSGSVTNCNFINNTATNGNGGAIIMGSGNVTNCNFTGNNAITGSAIYFYSNSATKTVSNSRFLNNRANAEDLQVTKNDNNITIVFTGKDNLLNAIYSSNDAEVTFTNVTYWSANGIATTESSAIKPPRSNKEAGQKITVEIYDSNDNLVENVTYVTDDNGQVTYDFIKLSNGDYKYKAYHSQDCYYTYKEYNDTFTLESDLGDFNRLQEYINGAGENSVITLCRNYTFTIGSDENLAGGIVIDKQLTINGNGFTIDAKGKSRIFYVTAGSINITDVTLKNGKADHGGAIYFRNAISNSNINATYINNTANGQGFYDGGGANYFNGDVSCSNITGTYANNTATWKGGANYFVNSVSDSIITGTYTGNNANMGGANYFEDSVLDSNIGGTYTGNNATNQGGANYFYSSVSDSNVSGTYINNTAKWYGGANSFSTVSGSSISGTYASNTATNMGGANYFSRSVSGSNIGGTYINNTAERGGGANNFDSVSTSNISGTYINNNATYGGANYFWGSVLGSNVSGTFINNTAEWDGGANYFDSVSTSNISGTYINNTAEQNGGANRFGSVLGSNVSGTFINNTAEWDGGANVFWSGVLGSNVSGTYINNTAKNKGGANYFDIKVSGSNVSGIYINNTASIAVIHFEDYFNRGLDANITNAIFLNNNCTYEIYARTSGIVVKDSWFGNNASNFMNKPNVNDKVTVDNWLFLNATVNPSSLLILDSSKVTFKLYSTDGINVSDFDNSKLPAVNLTLTATNGDVDKTTTLDNMVKYVATEHGKGSVTAKIENATYTIYSDNILRDVDLSVSAQNITYPENEILTLTYNNTATGKVNITLKSKNYKKTIEMDINRTITIADLPAGEYDVTIEYLGDNVFSNATSSAYFTVEKITTEIIPDKKTIELFVDDEYKITYTLKPDNALGNVSFSSNDTNIASVDSESGKIMANAEGSATITVSFSGNENYTASNATVTVNVKKIPTQITVNSSDIDMKVNGETDVGTGLEPANAGNLTYKSSDENIVIVENGKIKGLKEGNATITVSFAGNKKYAAAENKTITVNVRLNDASVSINNATLDLFVDDTFTIVANTTPVGLNVTYTPDNSGVVSVDSDGVVTALKEGTASIVVKVGGDGVYAKNSTIVAVTVNKIPTEIIVQNATVDMKVSDEVDSVVSLMPSGAGELDFTSSDVSVVTVDGIGTITAVGEGTANITVRFLGNDKYAAAESKNITVTVTKIGTSIDVDVDTINMKVGDEVAVNATLTPGEAGELDYTSSDVSVVTVNGIGEITAVGEGTANVTVRFLGNDKYAAAESKNITVTVSLNDASVSVNNSTLDLFVDDNFSIVATTVPDGLNVTYVPDNSGVISVDESGEVTALKEGTATITVKVGGDGIYAENSTAISVTVNKQDANVNVSMPANVTVGDNSTVSVKLPSDATGNVTVKVDGEVVDTVAVTDGTADVTIPSLSAGNHTVEIAYSGDGKYNPSNETKEIAVSKKETTPDITIPSDITVGDDSNVNITLPSDATGNVTLKVDGEVVSTVPVTNGTASVELPILSAGNHTVEIAYSGDEKYSPVTQTKEITVSKQNATADVTVPSDITVGDDSNIEIKLPSDAGGNITVKVDGEVVGVVPVKDGSANVSLSSLKAGNHTVEISYSGDDKYNPVSETKDVSVSKQDATPEIAVDDSNVNVKLPDDATGDVTVKVDDAVVSTAEVTNGTAAVILPKLGAGNHTVEVSYSGDDKYNPSAKTTTVTVNVDTSILTADNVTATYKVDKYLTITLTDSQGSPIANATVSVKLKSAKNYTSDENGQIKVKVSNLVPKTYTAKITFKGDDNYTGSNTTAKVLVKKATAKITAKAKTFKTTTKTKKYAVTLKANGKALKNKWVYLKVNGKTYKAKTNSKGKATFKITKLNKAGKFKATVTFKGNDYYKKATKKATIKVKSVWKTIQKGSKNSAIVKKIQRALKNHGYYLEYNGHYLMVDGIFWDYTEMAVKEFQNDKTLKVTGKVDEKTAKKLGII